MYMSAPATRTRAAETERLVAGICRWTQIERIVNIMFFSKNCTNGIQEIQE